MADLPPIKVRRNPATREEIEQAKKDYEKFHWGIPPRRVKVRRVAKPLRVGHKLGRLVSVTYEARKGNEDNGRPIFWVHEFGEKGGRRPDLVADDDQNLHIVGGDYRIEEAGIID